MRGDGARRVKRDKRMYTKVQVKIKLKPTHKPPATIVVGVLHSIFILRAFAPKKKACLFFLLALALALYLTRTMVLSLVKRMYTKVQVKMRPTMMSTIHVQQPRDVASSRDDLQTDASL